MGRNRVKTNGCVEKLEKHANAATFEGWSHYNMLVNNAESRLPWTGRENLC